MGFIGLFATAGTFLFETPRLPETGGEWAAIATLALVCSCFGFTLQPVAQRRVSAEKAGMFCALNPLTAAALGLLFLGERPTLPGILGAGLIGVGFLLRSLPQPLPRPHRRTAPEKCLRSIH